MSRMLLALACLMSSAGLAPAAPMGTAARNVIPQDVQQIISVDYRQLANQPMAAELHDRALPDNLKRFEAALKSLGITPERDIDHLSFASFRQAGSLRMLGVAEGDFALKTIQTKIRTQKVKPLKYRNTLIYPVDAGLDMTLLDAGTMVFGDIDALKFALRARDGDIQSLNANSALTDIMPGVDSGAVWSVLDSEGTQNMLRSALGDAAKLADYETLKKRLLSSRYQMNFDNGIKFDLDVITSDSVTAATLATVVKAGLMLKKIQATGAEKALLEGTDVDSDSNQLQMHFHSDEKKFETLLNSALFNAVSR